MVTIKGVVNLLLNSGINSSSYVQKFVLSSFLGRGCLRRAQHLFWLRIAGVATAHMRRVLHSFSDRDRVLSPAQGTQLLSAKWEKVCIGIPIQAAFSSPTVISYSPYV